MQVERSPEASQALAALREALKGPVGGDASPLRDWLGRELDDSGAPMGLPLDEWAFAARAIAEARRDRPGWPEDLDARAVDFVRMLLRFSRPGGATATARDVPPSPRPFWGTIARAFPAADVGRVLAWWFPGRGDERDEVTPPSTAWSARDRVLGVLRADWTARGDLLAFDQREGSTTRFELFGSGVSWLGSRWESASEGSEAPAKATAWAPGTNADVAEWSFRSGGREVTRLALMLHGRRLALLADLHDAGDGATMSLEVPAGLTPQAGETPGSTTLRPGKAGKSARAALMVPGRAEFDEGTRRLRLSAGSRWLPMLVSWDHARHRKPPSVVELTVAEDGRRCPKDVAWAARASWGRDETFVFYRSLGPAARRSFLGCSTTARLLVGRFTPEGDVEPIVTLA